MWLGRKLGEKGEIVSQWSDYIGLRTTGGREPVGEVVPPLWVLARYSPGSCWKLL